MEFNWNDLLYLIVIPIVQQLIKWISDNTGYTFEKWLNQLISLVLAGGLAYLVGDFAGLALPIWEGDLIAYILGAAGVIGVAWGSLMLSYEVIWDRLFQKVKFVTGDKL